MTTQFKFMLVFAFIAIMALGLYADYETTNSFDAKVYSVNVQQKTHGDKDGFYTSYSYIVSTSKGTYSISPDGIFASSAFGSL